MIQDCNVDDCVILQHFNADLTVSQDLCPSVSHITVTGQEGSKTVRKGVCLSVTLR